MGVAELFPSLDELGTGWEGMRHSVDPIAALSISA